MSAPLLLVHGAYHGAWCFDEWIGAFEAAGVQAAAVDLRGHGALAPAGLSPETRVADYSSDVRRAAERLPAPPVLVGHSMGALVTMAAAQEMRVSGLVLVAPSPPGNLPGARRVPPVPEEVLRPPPGLDEVRERFLGRDPSVDAAGYAARLCPESPAALNERYELRVAIDPAQVRVPVLVLEAGLDDPLRHPAGQDAAIARFFGGTHLLLPEAPHCMMVGRSAQASARLVAEWLQDRRLGARRS